MLSCRHPEWATLHIHPSTSMPPLSTPSNTHTLLRANNHSSPSTAHHLISPVNSLQKLVQGVASSVRASGRNRIERHREPSEKEGISESCPLPCSVVFLSTLPVRELGFSALRFAFELPSHHVSSRHVKALESRSQLLDAALASADEANRRWEECRTLVDQLRIENAALRAALSQAQAQLGQLGQGPILPTPPTPTAQQHPQQPQQQQQQHQPQESSPKDEKKETPVIKSDG